MTITYAEVVDTLSDHDYAVYVGAKWERVNGEFGDYFYTNDYHYEDNLDSDTDDYPSDWYQMGSQYDLQHTVGSTEGTDASTQRSWQKPNTETGYELVIWVRLVWKYTFIITTYHHSYDQFIIHFGLMVTTERISMVL